MEVRIVNSFDLDLKTKIAWTELVRERADDIHGVDVTMTYEWLKSVWEVHNNGKEQLSIVIIEDEGEVVVIAPFYKSGNKQSFGYFFEIVSVPQMYCGREGFLIKNDDPIYFNELMSSLLNKIHPRAIVRFSVVEGSASHALLETSGHKVNVMSSTAATTPYILIPRQWSELYDSLKKKLRYSIRNSERQLNQNGLVNVKSYSDENLDELLEAIYSIERESWKETAGTSITKNPHQKLFYETFTPIAAKKGWMKSFVLFLDGQPIAYIYGLVFQGIYYDFKESVSEKHRSISVGHVLKMHVFKELCNCGVRVFDYMGRCEAYKMQWTNRTYSVRTYSMCSNKIFKFFYRLKPLISSFLTSGR